MGGDLLHSVPAVLSAHVVRDLGPSGGGEAAVDGSGLDGDGAAHRHGLGRREAAGAGLGGVVQGNPTGSALELAPLGSAGAAGLRNDGIDTGLDSALTAVVGAGAGTDIEVRRGHFHRVVYGCLSAAGCAGAGAGGSGAGAAAQPLSDLGGNLAVEVVEVITRASLVRKPAVNGHHHLTRLGGVGEGLRLVPEPEQLLGSVPAANIRHQVQKRGIGRSRDLVGVLGLAGRLNGDGAVIVGPAGGTPAPVLFLHAQADGAVMPHNVVAGSAVVRVVLGKGPGVAAALRRHLTDETMDADGVDFVIAGACPVGTDFRIGHKGAVTHGRFPPCPP